MSRCEQPITRALGALIAGTVLLASGTVAATQSIDGGARRSLESVEGALERHRGNARELTLRADRLNRELEAVRARLIGLMPRIDASQASIEKADERLAELAVATTHKQQALEGRREETSITLASLSRLSRRSAISILASAGSPVDTYRGARLMSMLVERLEDEAREIRADLAALAALRREVETEGRRRTEGKRALQVRRLELERLLSVRSGLRGRLEVSRRREERHVARLAGEAKTLVELVLRLSRLEEQRRRDAAERAAAERRAVLDRRAKTTARVGRTRERRRETAAERAKLDRTAREAERAGRDRVAHEHTRQRVMAAREVEAATRRAELEARRRAEQEARRQAELVARRSMDREARLRADREARRRADEATRREASEPEKTLRTAELPPPLRLFSESRGKLPLPARGRIIGRFGAATGTAGQSLKGIRLRTTDHAPVVAPYDGKVVFVGEYRDYGLLLIISLGEGYHLLLSGMSRVYGVVGQRVLAGEPVGEMSKIDDAPPTLYVELRRGGKPINPLPWMAAAKGKVSG